MTTYKAYDTIFYILKINNMAYIFRKKTCFRFLQNVRHFVILLLCIMLFIMNFLIFQNLYKSFRFFLTFIKNKFHN